MVTPAFTRLSHLGDMSVDTFLKEYWQKKPLLIRNAFPDFENPVTPDELAGLSLEDEVTSRLVFEHGINGKTPWQVKHGPFAEDLYAQLPEKHWTLLVQHADLLHPDITRILAAFRFIPNWRLDDIMISYATDQGSVGPHFDYYDVFLLQAEGRRRWRLGQACNSSSPLIPDLAMKILAEFTATEDWIVEPGDLLYIPPGLAHWGVAEGECMTYSIGFRAPSHNDILLDFVTEAAATTSEDQRYSDPDLSLQKHAGEITLSAVKKLQAIIHHYTDDTTGLATWFGKTMTQANPGGECFGPDPLTPEELDNNQPFQLAPQIRSAFFDSGERAILFINGESWHCSKALAESLAGYLPLTMARIEDRDQAIIRHCCEAEYLSLVL